MRTHGTAVTLTGLLSLALVAGCSGGEGTGSPTGPATPSVTAAPAPAEPTTATSSAEPDAGDDATQEAPGENSTEDVAEDVTGEPGTGVPADEEPTVTGPAGPTDPGAGEDPGEDGSAGGDPADPPADGLAVPEGSGCTPGEGPLPDGQWYGEVDGADTAGVQLDLQCFFLGEEADRAALEDGEVMVPVPNGYYVRNTDPAVRTFDVAAGTQVLHYPTGDPATARVLGYAEWAGLVRDGQVLLLGVWLTVDDGAVVAVEEQWTP
ncbi:hypothetical protein [Ornithinimicrobium sufpigmenti]|uniref:hypothetical protein n=1 Tax=Ornithinimicrobium sufpigmenti TaxID=2508882 RepID=UPI001035803B|nr:MULTISPECIES: hypothetical protein [unclassified Ornithinimicrobium]